MAWSLDDIKKRILKYKLALLKEKDFSRKELLKETINSLEGVIKYFHTELSNRHQTFREVYRTDKNLIDSYYKLNPLILNFCDNFSDEEIDFIDTLNTNKNINSTDIMNVVKDFFDSIQDPRFKYIFDSLYSNHEFYTKFRPATKQNTKNNTGITFNIFNTPEVFFLINYSRNINDYLATTHEYAHGISFKLNEYNSIDFGKYPFNETDAIFFEMLMNEKLSKKKEYEIDALVTDIDRFYDYALDSVLIQSKIELHSLLEHNSKLRKSDIYDFLLNEQRLDTETARDVLYKEMYCSYNYVISYLTAIELLFLYRSDSKKALDALFDLITLKDSSSIEHLDMLRNKYGILIGANTHLYFNEIKNRVEEMKHDKKVQYTIK